MKRFQEGAFARYDKAPEKTLKDCKKVLTIRKKSASISHVLFRAKVHGGIAQLGERLNGIQEVSGSIPLISTKTVETLGFQRFFLFSVRMQSH